MYSGEKLHAHIITHNNIVRLATIMIVNNIILSRIHSYYTPLNCVNIGLPTQWINLSQ